MGKYNLSLSPE